MVKCILFIDYLKNSLNIQKNSEGKPFNPNVVYSMFTITHFIRYITSEYIILKIEFIKYFQRAASYKIKNRLPGNSNERKWVSIYQYLQLVQD